MARIEQWGTFDVHNYGDLLFPLVLKQELARSLGPITQTLAAPNGGRFPGDETQNVRRITRLEDPGFFSQALESSGIVLGGGDIIRFDDENLARLYGWSAQSAASSRFFTLFVDDLGQLARIYPVFWNAVGVPFEIPLDCQERLRASARHVRYLSVRDELSKKRLERAGVEREIEVVPDTAFLVPPLFDSRARNAIVERFRGLGYYPARGQVLTFQVSATFMPSQQALATILAGFQSANPELSLCLLPIGICHDDLRTLRALCRRMGGRVFLVDTQTRPDEVGAVIADSTYFVGSSLHGNITAYAYGVPHLVLAFDEKPPTKLGQYAALVERQDCLIQSIDDLSPGLSALVQNRHPVDTQLYHSIVGRIHAHFDRIANEIRLMPEHDRGRPEYEMLEARVYSLEAAVQQQNEMIAAYQESDNKLRAEYQELEGWAHDLESTVQRQNQIISTFRAWAAPALALRSGLRRIRRLVRPG